MKRLGRKKKLSKEVKRLAKILNANPSLIASASNRKLLKLKKKNKNLKEEKSMEHTMRLRHQKMNNFEKDVSTNIEHNSEPSKTEESAADKESSSSKNSSPNASSEGDNTTMPPCLTPAADPENSLDQLSASPVEPPSLQAHISESKDDAEMNNWRSLPRRAKRPAPTSPVRKPPKKRGRPKVRIFYFTLLTLTIF